MAALIPHFTRGAPIREVVANDASRRRARYFFASTGAVNARAVHRQRIFDVVRRFGPISRAELAVMIDVICWPPMESFTSAISPLMRTDSILPMS